jgi:hypothetical protein
MSFSFKQKKTVFEGCIPVFIKHGELNQYTIKVHFRWSLSKYLLGLGFLATCFMGSNIIGQYKFILTNNAQELTPGKFELYVTQTENEHIFCLCRNLNPDL